MLLRKLLDDSLLQTRMDLSQDPAEKVHLKMSEVIKMAMLSNKEKFANVTNYDFFLLFISYFNINQLDYDEIDNLLRPSESFINSWTYQQTRILETVSNMDPQYPNINTIVSALEKLKLSNELYFLQLQVPFRLMSNVLLFRRNIEELSTKSQFLRGSKLYQKAYDDTDFKELFRILKEDCETTLSDTKTNKEILEQRLKYSKEVEEALEEGTLFELNSIPNEWHLFLEPNVLTEIYNIIIQNQTLLFNEETNKNQNLVSKINSSKLSTFLYQNNINPKDIPSFDELDKIDFIILEQRINFLLSIGINLPTILFKYTSVLLLLDVSSITKLTMLINRNYLKKETLLENILDSSKLRNISTNYSILKDIINPNNPYYKDTILLLEPSEIRKRISIIKEYSLSQNDYMFLLSNIEFLHIFDLIIENDIPEYLFISICKTYNPELTIKKIIICREINEPFLLRDKTLKKEVSKEEMFFCPDKEVDKYLNRHQVVAQNSTIELTSIIADEQVEELDSEHKSGMFYTFNQTKISRPKVLRYLQKVKNSKLPVSDYLYTSIISNSLLTNVDLINIKNSLENNITFA